MSDITLVVVPDDVTSAARPAEDTDTTAGQSPGGRRLPLIASAGLSLGLAAHVAWGGGLALSSRTVWTDDTRTLVGSYPQPRTVGHSTGLASVDRPAGPLSVEFARIDHFMGLGYNWNTYGAYPPSQSAASEAKRFLATIWNDFGPQKAELARPTSIAPLPSGGIQLGWRSAGAEIELEVSPKGLLSYLFIDRRSGTTTYTESDDAAWPDATDRVGEVLNS